MFEGEPQPRHYNPLGSVHAGFAATLLDSALACSVHSTLVKGETYTTLEIKVNLVRAVTEDTGGSPPRRASCIAAARSRPPEATLKDRAGKLYAHATTTCMIFPAK